MLRKIWMKIATAFNQTIECRHGDIQCGKCAEDWYADGEGIGPVIPRHDRAQAGRMPEGRPIVSDNDHTVTNPVVRSDTQDL